MLLSDLTVEEHLRCDIMLISRVRRSESRVKLQGRKTVRAGLRRRVRAPTRKVHRHVTDANFNSSS